MFNKKDFDKVSKTKIAVALGAGGIVLTTIASYMQGTVLAPAAIETVWQALTVAFLTLGVRGWFKK